MISHYLPNVFKIFHYRAIGHGWPTITAMEMLRKHAYRIKQRVLTGVDQSDDTNRTATPKTEDTITNDTVDGLESTAENEFILVDMCVSYDNIIITKIQSLEHPEDERSRFTVWYKQKTIMRRASLENNQFHLKNLTPNTEYEIFFVEDLGGPETCIIRKLAKTAFCGPPRNLIVVQSSEGYYSVSWDDPLMDEVSPPVSQYKLEVIDYMSKEPKLTRMIAKQEFNNDILELDSSCSYILSVRAVFGRNMGEKAYHKEIELKHNVLETIKWFESTGSCRIYQIPLVEKNLPESNIISKEFGKQTGVSMALHNKVILLVGASGAGKTTWINSFINYVLGVDRKDQFRFKIVRESAEDDQTVSKTENIAMYKIHHRNGMKMHINLTVIDTPGFADTRGVERDDDIQKDFYRLFQKKYGFVPHINAVGFVQQASAHRLTGNQKYIFEKVLSLFGKDIEERIFLLLTFADTKQPPVLKAFDKAGITYNEHFKFNNSCIFPESNADVTSEVDDAMWHMGMKNMRNFLSTVEKLDDKPASLTADVLKEREKIRLHISNLRRYVDDSLIKLEQLKTEEELLMYSRQGVVSITNVVYRAHHDTNSKKHLVCQKCSYTCHKNCLVAESGKLEECLAMEQSTGYNCKMCLNRCSLQLHTLSNTYYERHVCNKETSLEIVRARYQTKNKTLSTEQICNDIVNDLDGVTCRIKASLSEIVQALQRLSEIALIHVPKSQVDYIDQWIRLEEHEVKPGYKVRVQFLQQLRQQAVDIASIQNGEFDPFDPFKKYREAAELARANGQNMLNKHVWANVANTVSGIVSYMWVASETS